MNRERLANGCERGVAGLVVAILVYSALATGAVRTLDFLVVQGLVIGVLVLWLVRLWTEEGPRLHWPPICWAVLAFMIYAVVRYATADIEYVARKEMIRVLVYGVLFFAIVNNLQRQETCSWIVRVMVLLGMCVAAYGIYQYLTGDNHVWNFVNPYTKRGSGTFINPNHFAGFLELILPVGLAHLLAGHSRKPVLMILMSYALLVITVGIALSFSRGGWLATTVSLIVFFAVLMFQRRHRWQALVSLAAVTLLAVIFSTHSIAMRYRLERAFRGGDVNTELRTELWKPALEMWRENPWLGVGPGHYDYRFREFRPASVQKRPGRAHNDYLNTLADWGVVGGGIIAVAMVLLTAGVVRTWRWLKRGGDGDSQGSDRLGFVLGASCALLAILVHSLVDFNMQIPSNAMLAVTWMALLTNQLRYATGRSRFGTPVLVRGIWPVFLLALLGYLGWQWQLRAREYVWLERGENEEKDSAEQLAMFEKAFAVEPMNFETAHAIGEMYRARGWDGGAGYQELAEQAITWYERGAALDPYDPNDPLHHGMCLDLLGEHSKAEPFYWKANALDPKGYFTTAHIGLHYVQVRDFPAAREWFERSLRLQNEDNTVSATYMKIIQREALDAATNRFALPLLKSPDSNADLQE